MKDVCINPSNAQLNPICHLLTLLEAHHILHISRIRVNSDCIKHIHTPAHYFRWIIPVVLISILNKSVGTSSTIYIGIKITHET